jgi:hypothetical protein
MGNNKYSATCSGAATHQRKLMRAACQQQVKQIKKSPQLPASHLSVSVACKLQDARLAFVMVCNFHDSRLKEKPKKVHLQGYYWCCLSMSSINSYATSAVPTSVRAAADTTKFQRQRGPSSWQRMPIGMFPAKSPHY